MLVSVLPVPFADAARQRQYEAVLAALHAEPAAPATVLLGNLAAFTPVEADLLVVRPGGLALLVLTPHAGHLTVPALTYGPWQLDGQPLPGRLGGDNPFAQYQQQLAPVLAWLGEQLDRPANELPPCLGIALFEAPLTFGPGVEAQLHRHPDAPAFELVGAAALLPARLRPLPAAGATSLRAAELIDWGEYLVSEAVTPRGQEAALGLRTVLEQKLRQLWRWLGAEDIPADPPYGGAPPDLLLRDQQEQARLQQLRQELQAELHQQRREAAAREVARAQELAQLRQQLTQAGTSATERQAEQQAKVALEESVRTARAELAARNQELDARIQQLGQLIGRLQAPAAGPAPASPLAATPTSAKRPQPAAPPAWSFRRLRQAERWGLAALVVMGTGWGLWSLGHWAQQPSRPAATPQARQAPVENNSAAFLRAEPDYAADSLGQAQATSLDTAATSPAQAEPPITEEATELVIKPTPLRVDSAKLFIKQTPLLDVESDSTTSQTSPTP